MRASQLRIIEQQGAGNQLASWSGFTARQKVPPKRTPLGSYLGDSLRVLLEIR
jgi:hypothetical protein